MKMTGAQLPFAGQPLAEARASAVPKRVHEVPLMPLASANAAMRAGDHPTAAILYLQALQQYPDLLSVIGGNLDLLRRRFVRTLSEQVVESPIMVGVKAQAVDDECRALCRRWLSLDEAVSANDRDRALADALLDAAQMVASRPGSKIVLSEGHLIVWMVAALYQRLWGATVALAQPTPGLANVREGMASLWRSLGGASVPLAKVLLSSQDDSRAVISSHSPSKTGLPREEVRTTSADVDSRRNASRVIESPGGALALPAPPVLPAARPSAPVERPFHFVRPWLAQSELQRLPVTSSMLRLGACVVARAESVSPASALTLATFARLCRLRVPDELLAQASEPPTAAAAACNLLALPVDGLKTLGLDYASERRLRLRVDAAALPEGNVIVIRAYQRELDRECLALVGEAVVSKRLLLLLEFALTDAYSPVLLTATTPDARLIAAALVPFPSLCPGGVHAAEAIAARARSIVALSTLSRQLLLDTLRPSHGNLELAIAAPGATAAELVFCRDFTEWLVLLFSVRVVAWGASNLEEMRIEAATSLPELVLPANAFPAIRMLATARAAGCWPSAHSFLLVERTSWRGLLSLEIREPRCLVQRLFAPESLKRPISRVSYSQSSGRPSLAAGAPCALLQQDPSPLTAIRLLAPVAPGLEVVPEFTCSTDGHLPIRVVAVCGSVEHGVALAEALALQERAQILALRLVAPKAMHAPLQAAVPSSVATRTRIVDSSLADAADELAGDDGWLLVLGRPVLPHDARTVLTLCSLASAEDVVATTCHLVACDAKGTRGLGAGYAVFRRADGLCMTRPVDGALHLPQDVFPVVATGNAVCMTTSNRWRASREALFSEQSGGGFCLATTRISVQLLDESSEDIDPLVPADPVFVMSELPT